MRQVFVAATLAVLAAPLQAETPAPAADVPLTAEAFDALTLGKTMDTLDAELGLYGVERFLPGQRVYWKDADRCMEGTWYQQDDQICFLYEDKLSEPVCWVYFDKGDHIEGWFFGDFDSVPIMLYDGAAPFSCDTFLGA